MRQGGCRFKIRSFAKLQNEDWYSFSNLRGTVHAARSLRASFSFSLHAELGWRPVRSEAAAAVVRGDRLVGRFASLIGC